MSTSSTLRSANGVLILLAFSAIGLLAYFSYKTKRASEGSVPDRVKILRMAKESDVKGERANAERLYIQSLELRPNSPSILLNIADFYDRVGKSKVSLAYYDQLFAPKNGRKARQFAGDSAFCRYGELCEKLGRLDDARRIYLACQPEFSRLSLRDPIEKLHARACYQAAFTLRQAAPKVFEELTTTTKEAVQIVQTRRLDLYRHAITLDPTFALAHARLAEVGGLSTKEVEARYRIAIQHLQSEEIASFPYYDPRIRRELKQAFIEKAISVWKESDPESGCKLVACLLDMKRKSEGIRIAKLIDAKSLKPSSSGLLRNSLLEAGARKEAERFKSVAVHSRFPSAGVTIP